MNLPSPYRCNDSVFSSPYARKNDTTDTDRQMSARLTNACSKVSTHPGLLTPPLSTHPRAAIPYETRRKKRKYSSPPRLRSLSLGPRSSALLSSRWTMCVYPGKLGTSERRGVARRAIVHNVPQSSFRPATRIPVTRFMTSKQFFVSEAAPSRVTTLVRLCSSRSIYMAILFSHTCCSI